VHKYARALQEIIKKPTEEAVRRVGVSVGDLVSRSLVVRQKRAEKRYLVPEGAPCWATRFRYSRKKYGIEEHTSEKTILKITERGQRYLKRESKNEKDKSETDDKLIVDNGKSDERRID